MRDGKEEVQHRNNLKVGDVIKIVNGMNIPVDGLCVEASGVLSDESSMTGESDHLIKETYDKCRQRQQEHEAEEKSTRTAHDVPSPVLLSGTQIQTGEGWFLTIVVGPDTCENQIMAAVEAKNNETTPLQDKLEVIATDIGKLGMYCAILIIHCLLIRQFVESMMRRNFDLWGGELTSEGKECNPLTTDVNDEDYCSGYVLGYVKNLLGYYIVGVAIIVVAVPEGLPLAVMISLSYSISKMLKDKNFVKRLSSCEIMGGANNICSDKTGTLTKNQMTWTQIWAGSDTKLKNVDGTEPFNTSEFIFNEKTKKLLSEAVSCNCIGTTENAGATELAMLKFIKRCGVDYEAMRKAHLPKQNLLRFPFDSARKRMSTVLENVTDNAKGYDKRIHVKGASEIVLATCTTYLDNDGNE